MEALGEADLRALDDLYARVIWIPDGDIGKFAGRLPALLRDDFPATMNLLRNPQFQEVLLNYPRAKRTFWIAPEAKDEVSSVRVERFGKFRRKGLEESAG